MKVRQFVLYRFYDVEDNLLYVGQSINVWNRFTQHQRKTVFYPLATRVTLQRGFRNAIELTKAEISAIQTEHPLYNVAYNGTPGIVPPIQSDNITDETICAITQAEYESWRANKRKLSIPERDLLHAIANYLDRGWTLNQAYQQAVENFTRRYGMRSAANIRPSSIPSRNQWKSPLG